MRRIMLLSFKKYRLQKGENFFKIKNNRLIFSSGYAMIDPVRKFPLAERQEG